MTEQRDFRQNEPMRQAPYGYPPYRYPQPPRKREVPRSSRRELVFGFVFLALGLLFSLATPFRERPFAVLLLLLVLFALTALFFGKEAFRLTARSSALLGFYALFLLPYLTNANAVLRFFSFVASLILLSLFWYELLVLKNQRLEDRDVWGAARSAVLSYFKRWHWLGYLTVASMGRGERAKKGWRTVGFIGIGLAVAAIPTLIVGLLLSYDASFTALFEFDFDFSPEKLFERIWDLVLAFVFGSLFFSLVMTVKGEKRRPSALVSQGSVPRVILYAALTPLLLLYAIFFFSQKKYYLSAFTKALPEGLTYATYAREGFFQLCAVACINFAVFVAFSILVRKKEGERELVCRIYQGILALFTLILIATALSKMALYIGAYGLTQKRVYASWLMLLLSAVFLMIVLKQMISRFPFFKASFAVALVFFALIALPNVDGVIATYNVDRYLDGDLESVDVDELIGLGVSSVEARIRLENEWLARGGLLGTDSLSEVERNALSRLSASLDEAAAVFEYGFFSFSIPNYRAKRLLEARESV